MLQQLRMRPLWVLACGLGLSPAWSAEPSGAFSSDVQVIRLGALIDQTGASTTPLFRSAVELAANQMNEALVRTKSPLRFEFAYGDTRSDPALAKTEAIKLINTDDVKGLVVDSSGDTVAVARLNYDPSSGIAHKAAITCFQCSSSFIHDPGATDNDAAVQAAERDPDHWTFRVFYNARYEAAVILRLALAKTHKSAGDSLRIGIFADGGHKSLAVGLVEALPRIIGTRGSANVVYVSKIETIGADWAKLLTSQGEMSGSSGEPPDVVIVAMLPAAATEAIRTYRKGGFGTAILSNNSFRRDYILAGIGEAANGLEGSSVGLVDRSEAGAAFSKAFQEATGKPAELTSSGAYDSAVALMLAALVARGGDEKPHDVTSADVRLGLTRINDRAGLVVRPAINDFASAIQQINSARSINYEGAYDPLDWNPSGDIFPPLVHWKVEGGRFVEYESYDCNPTKPLCGGG